MSPLTIMLVLVSPKMEKNSQVQIELQAMGFEVIRQNKQERYVAISATSVSIEEAVDFWHKPVFLGHPAEIIRVGFFDLECQSINGYLAVSDLGFGIMEAPTDPVHSRLFRFKVSLDHNGSLNKISRCFLGFESVKENDKNLFNRLLKICAYNFYQPEGVNFINRKKLGKIKRQYLLFLDRENRVPENLQSAVNFQKTEVIYHGWTVGHLKGAEEAWNNLVAQELSLQSCTK